MRFVIYGKEEVEKPLQARLNVEYGGTRLYLDLVDDLGHSRWNLLSVDKDGVYLFGSLGEELGFKLTDDGSLYVKT